VTQLINQIMNHTSEVVPQTALIRQFLFFVLRLDKSKADISTTLFALNMYIYLHVMMCALQLCFLE